MSLLLVLAVAAAVGSPPLVTDSTPAGARTVGLDVVLDSALNRSMAQELLRLDVTQAEGKATSAQGGFDPQASGRSRVESLGNTKSSLLGAKVVQRLGLVWGAAVSAGYRNGTAEAVYDGKTATSTLGEAYAELTVPLLRDGYIDPVRTDAEVAGLSQNQAELGAEAGALHLARASAELYLAWKEKRFVATVQQWLLDLAQQREAGIARQVEEGSRAALELWDNQRLVAERRAGVERAQGDVDVSAYKLQAAIGGPVANADALRNAGPRLLEVHLRRFGPDGAHPDEGVGTGDGDLWHRICDAGPPSRDEIDRALHRHPLLRQRAVGVEAARAQQRLAQNQLLPRVDSGALWPRTSAPPAPTGKASRQKTPPRQGSGSPSKSRPPTARPAVLAGRRDAKLRASQTKLAQARLSS